VAIDKNLRHRSGASQTFHFSSSRASLWKNYTQNSLAGNAKNSFCLSGFCSCHQIFI
jgi:hypothetical protein